MSRPVGTPLKIIRLRLLYVEQFRHIRLIMRRHVFWVTKISKREVIGSHVIDVAEKLLICFLIVALKSSKEVELVISPFLP